MPKQPPGTNQALVRAASGVGDKYAPPINSRIPCDDLPRRFEVDSHAKAPRLTTSEEAD